MEIFVYILFVFILFSILLIFLSFFIKFQQLRKKALVKYTVLEVQVPKESEISPIGAEHVFATFHGIFFLAKVKRL